MEMEIEKAVEIIKALADGIDPATGDVLPAESPYQNPRTIRALFAAISALQKEEGRSRGQKNLPNNAGKPWFEDEDSKLVELFESGTTIAELASTHKRTKGAIQSRLIKLGKIQRPL